MIERLYLVIEIIATLICINNTFNQKFRADIATITIIFIETLTLNIINTQHLSVNYGNLIYLELLIYCQIEYRPTFPQLILRYAIAAIQCSIIQLAASVPIILLWNNNQKQDQRNLAINLVFLVLACLIAKKIPIGQYLNKLTNKYLKEKTIIILTAILTIAYLINMKKQHQGISVKNLYIPVLILLALTMSTLRYIWTDYQLKQKENQIKIASMYDQTYQQLIQTARKQQHDYKNHLQALLSIGQAHNTAEQIRKEQQAYCNNLLKISQDTEILYKSNNHPLAAFLYSKIQTAKQQNIQTIYQISIHQCNNQIPLYETVEILGILLDNAYEAVAQQPQLEQKINLTIKEEDNGLKTKISNPVIYKSVEDFRNMLKNTKSTKGENRGLGLTKLKSYCEAYNMPLIINIAKRQDSNWIIFELEIKNKAVALKNKNS